MNKPVSSGQILPTTGSPLSFDQLENYVKDGRDITPFEVDGPVSYLVTSPTVAREILSDDKRFPRDGQITEALGKLFPNSFATTSREIHERQHSYHIQFLKRSNVASFDRFVGEAIKRLYERWSADTVPPFDLWEEMRWVTTQVTGTVISRNIDFTDPKHPIAVRRKTFAAWAAGNVSDEELGKTGDRLRTTFLNAIKDERDSGSSENDFLHVLLDHASHPENREWLTDDLMSGDMWVLMAGGSGSTAETLCWLFYELGRNPNVETKIIEECNRALNGRFPAATDLDTMPYLRSVIAEVIRLYPSDALIPRRVTRQEVISGTQLKEDTILYIAPWLMQRDARWWPEPTVFNPERWETVSSEARAAYMPFGYGHHTCLGRAYAEWLIPLMVIGITQSFHLSFNPPKQTVEPRLVGINIHAERPIMMSPMRRKAVQPPSSSQ
jgi:cytochrome P450